MRRLLRDRGAAPGAIAWLAPFVDVLTILLVFLLKSWSSDPPVRPDDPSFSLPASTAQGELAPALAVDLSEEAIHLRGMRVAGAPFYLEHEDALVEELYAPLQQLAARRLLIRADERVPYRLVRKVVFTAREAGVEQVAIVAESVEGL